MNRRDFVSTLGVGSAVLLTPAIGATRSPISGEPQDDHAHTAQAPMIGFGANAVINFGQWKTEPPLDRYPNLPPSPPQNSHQLLPGAVQIRAGGSVTFIISGLHQIVVYGPDVAPEDINANALVFTTGVPAGVPLINDPNNRLYRGPDPSLMGTFDRVESVHFPSAGRYLVICGVRPHFIDGMFGHIAVLP